MKWRAACCAILLVCLTLSAIPVTVATASTGVTGSVPLVTYDVAVTDIGHFTATVSWKTNAAATSQVFYDTRPHEDIDDYRFATSEDITFVSEHSVSLSRLRPRTTYHFRVRSAIPGTEFVDISDDYSFTTLSPPVRVIPPGPPPGVPPVVKSPATSGIAITDAITEFLNAGLSGPFAVNDRLALPGISPAIARYITWPLTGAVMAAVIVVGLVSQAPGPGK